MHGKIRLGTCSELRNLFKEAEEYQMKDSNAKKARKPGSVDEYISALPEEKRAALEKLRKMIKSVVPDATEVISYQIPVFKYKGRPLVGFGAAKNHCSFYTMSSGVAKAHRDDLKSYDTSVGTIRFPANKPLPATLVTKIVMARIAENNVRDA
jgi:uncharacterized protein YdhG (YjbR/CyaY superfamily)